MNEDVRLAPAREILRAAGFPQADVEAAGHDASIAVITRVDPARIGALAQLAEHIKSLGFRYVTLDIGESAS